MKNEALVKYLHEEKTRKIAFKTKFFKQKNTDFASDFDVFSALCGSISFFAGNYIRDDFLSIIETSVADSIEPFLLNCAEYRKDLWQRIFYEDADPFYDNLKYKKEFDILASDFYIGEKAIALHKLVCFDCDNIFEVLDKALLKINELDVKIINFDVRMFNYSRPDDFHAKESYEQLVQGMNGDVFWLWLLCRIFMKLDLKLRLIINSAPEAEKILNLFETVKVFPKIYICFNWNDKVEYKNLFDVVLTNYKKNISLEISISKEIDQNILSANLKNVLSVIPLTCINIACDCANVFYEALDIMLSDIVGQEEKMALLSSLYPAK